MRPQKKFGGALVWMDGSRSGVSMRKGHGHGHVYTLSGALRSFRGVGMPGIC